MLDRLRKRVADTLAETHTCTLATSGPAGIQASVVPCAAQDITLYLLIPDTSDHLFNLEIEPAVALTTPTWQLRGLAAIGVDGGELFSADQRQWHTVVCIAPLRLHIQPVSGVTSHAETIDFDQMMEK